MLTALDEQLWPYFAKFHRLSMTIVRHISSAEFCWLGCWPLAVPRSLGLRSMIQPMMLYAGLHCTTMRI